MVKKTKTMAATVK